MRKQTGIFIFIGSLWISLSAFAGEAAGAPVAKATGQESTLELLIKGGYVMIPLGICSLVAVTLFLERLIILRQKNVIDPLFLKELHELTRTSNPKLDKAYELSVNSKSPIAQILKVGIDRWRKNRGLEYIEKGLEEAALREVSFLERSLRGFKIIAGIAPLLGLLGTVYGMIHAFQIVALSSEAMGKAAKLANGIYEAMVTTAAGLTIAIPTLLVFYFFARKVDSFTDQIEEICSDFIDDYLDSVKK
jgi:biopolymer transport protein ExbB